MTKYLLKTLLHTCLTVICFSACKNDSKNTEQTYYAIDSTKVQSGGVQLIPIQTANGNMTVWTKRMGNNPKIKLLLLHGGPGATHDYFECMENFLPAEGIEFIYYDQLGCGNSTNTNDTTLWDLNRFVEEVETVRKALQLDSTNFYLLGHSWGGILATEYALKYQQHLKGLIISNMMSSCPDYGKYAEEVLSKQFDPKVLDTIKQIEKKGDFNNPKYMELLMPHFYNKHICRIPLNQWPEPVNRAFSKLNQSVYVTMQGPSEFGVSGKLEKWDRKADLKKITVPTLTIGATFDTMDPEHMKWMSTQFPNGSFLLCSKGSHMSMYDDQQTYMKGIIKFMKAVNDGNKKTNL
ncbi:MAG: proline iminopeptidase-family hydrolase [Sphingobacteriia bacterium]|nr:proline iminopeptidase-family hydrolase [Sphingobacteriia bacterium]